MSPHIDRKLSHQLKQTSNLTNSDYEINNLRTECKDLREQKQTLAHTIAEWSSVFAEHDRLAHGVGKDIMSGEDRVQWTRLHTKVAQAHSYSAEHIAALRAELTHLNVIYLQPANAKYREDGSFRFRKDSAMLEGANEVTQGFRIWLREIESTLSEILYLTNAELEKEIRMCHGDFQTLQNFLNLSPTTSEFFSRINVEDHESLFVNSLLSKFLRMFVESGNAIADFSKRRVKIQAAPGCRPSCKSPKSVMKTDGGNDEEFSSLFRSSTCELEQPPLVTAEAPTSDAKISLLCLTDEGNNGSANERVDYIKILQQQCEDGKSDRKYLRCEVASLQRQVAHFLQEKDEQSEVLTRTQVLYKGSQEHEKALQKQKNEIEERLLKAKQKSETFSTKLIREYQRCANLSLELGNSHREQAVKKTQLAASIRECQQLRVYKDHYSGPLQDSFTSQELSDVTDRASDRQSHNLNLSQGRYTSGSEGHDRDKTLQDDNDIEDKDGIELGNDNIDFGDSSASNDSEGEEDDKEDSDPDLDSEDDPIPQRETNEHANGVGYKMNDKSNDQDDNQSSGDRDHADNTADSNVGEEEDGLSHHNADGRKTQERRDRRSARRVEMITREITDSVVYVDELARLKQENYKLTQTFHQSVLHIFMILQDLDIALDPTNCSDDAAELRVDDGHKSWTLRKALQRNTALNLVAKNTLIEQDNLRPELSIATDQLHALSERIKRLGDKFRKTLKDLHECHQYKKMINVKVMDQTLQISKLQNDDKNWADKFKKEQSAHKKCKSMRLVHERKRTEAEERLENCRAQITGLKVALKVGPIAVKPGVEKKDKSVREETDQDKESNTPADASFADEVGDVKYDNGKERDSDDGEERDENGQEPDQDIGEDEDMPDDAAEEKAAEDPDDETFGREAPDLELNISEELDIRGSGTEDSSSDNEETDGVDDQEHGPTIEPKPHPVAPPLPTTGRPVRSTRATNPAYARNGSAIAGDVFLANKRIAETRAKNASTKNNKTKESALQHSKPTTSEKATSKTKSRPRATKRKINVLTPDAASFKDSGREDYNMGDDRGKSIYHSIKRKVSPVKDDSKRKRRKIGDPTYHNTTQESSDDEMDGAIDHT